MEAGSPHPERSGPGADEVRTPAHGRACRSPGAPPVDEGTGRCLARRGSRLIGVVGGGPVEQAVESVVACR
jgi:hypothetical protein